MIAFSTQSGGVPTVPEWLSDWQPPVGATGELALLHRDLGDGWHMVGVGDPLLFNPPKRWADCGEEGWRTALLCRPEKFLPAALARSDLRWCDAAPVTDLLGRVWLAPVILKPSGGRAFRVAYGPKWLPALTPAQIRAEEIVTAARGALLSGDHPPMEVACQWAAELLSITHHLTPGVIAALALQDEALTVSVLSVATGIPLEKADAGAGDG